MNIVLKLQGKPLPPEVMVNLMYEVRAAAEVYRSTFLTTKLINMITARVADVTKSVTDHIYFGDVDRPGIDITIRFFEFPSCLDDEVVA